MVRQGHPLEAIYQAEGRVTLEEIARFPQFIPSTRQGGYNRPWLDVMAMGAPVIACNYFNVPPFVVKRTDAVEWIPSPLAAEWEGTGLFTVIPLAGENRSVFTSRLFWAARDERDPLRARPLSDGIKMKRFCYTETSRFLRSGGHFGTTID